MLCWCTCNFWPQTQYHSETPHIVQVFWPRADEWLPERWMLKGKYTLGPTHTSAYMPFLTGSRSCIGRHLATLELQTLVIAIVGRVQLRLTKEHHSNIIQVSFCTQQMFDDCTQTVTVNEFVLGCKQCCISKITLVLYEHKMEVILQQRCQLFLADYHSESSHFIQDLTLKSKGGLWLHTEMRMAEC